MYIRRYTRVSEAGPTVYLPYSRRLASLFTICRSRHCKLTASLMHPPQRQGSVNKDLRRLLPELASLECGWPLRSLLVAGDVITIQNEELSILLTF